MRTDRSAYLADADALTRLGEPLLAASEFVIHEREL